MPLWRARNSTTLAGGLLGLHGFLVFFQTHADCRHSAEQKKLVLHRASRFCGGGFADVALASRFLPLSSTLQKGFCIG